MNTPPKVSVVTCFLNVGHYLQETIESVLAQTFSGWELLLIDDGSSDNSTEIARRYAAQYPGKIIYAQHEGGVNKGLSASRNLAISKARGEYLTFLDGDDIWRPEYLQVQVAMMEKYPEASMICEATEYWIDWIDPHWKNVYVAVDATPYRLYRPPDLALLLYPLSDGTPSSVCGMIVRKEVALRIGGFEAEFKGMYEDQVFLTKVYLNDTALITDTCNNLYRQRADSLVGTTKKNKKGYLQVRKQYLDWLHRYLTEHNIQYPEVWRLLHQGYLPYRRPFYYFVTKQVPRFPGIAFNESMRFAKKMLGPMVYALRGK